MKFFLPIRIVLVLVIYLLSLPSFSQTCPSLPGGYAEIYADDVTSQQYLYPGVVPNAAPPGAEGSKTIGYFFFDGQNVAFADRKIITIMPTLDGVNNGKVIFNLWELDFGAATELKIYRGVDELGILEDDINTNNFSTKVGNEYVIDGPATLVFYGETPTGYYNNIVRFLTGDILIQTCNEGRSGLVWKDFITPNTYVVVDDQENTTNNLSTDYLYLPACVAYFDGNRNFVRVETSYCLDKPKEAPSPGYWYYPGEYQYTLQSTNNYDIDRDGFNASIDNLKIARILWLLKKAETATYDVKGAIQWGVWNTQSHPVDEAFASGSWEQQAQEAVPSIPTIHEPTFSMNYANGETGVALVNSETIEVEIPFSWAASENGQTNQVALVVPADVTIQSVTGGTWSGGVLTFSAPVATLTLASSTVGKYTIQAVYDNPLYYNVSNLQVYTPCSSTLESQAFLHIGEENPERPFRSITAEWRTSLPVRLIKFDAQLENNSSILQWQTADEINFSHFEVERGTDAKKWISIGRVETNASGLYKFTDANINNAKTIYYRLKMVDKDNTYGFSTIRGLSLEDANSAISLYPNPAVTTLQVSNLNMNDIRSMVVFDTFGVAKIKEARFDQGSLDISNLANGIYVVQMHLRNKTTISRTIVVKR